MPSKVEAVPEYSIADLLEVATAARPDAWRVKAHPDNADALTIYSRHGYVIHPGRGYVNDDDDARFMATFDPPTVRRLLERLAAVRDYIEDTEPDDWTVAFQRITAILAPLTTK